MTIITQHPTRKRQLQEELYLCKIRSISRDNGEEYRLLEWEIYHALNIAELNRTPSAEWLDAHPECEHGLHNCPLCHTEKPYRPEWDIPAWGLQ